MYRNNRIGNCAASARGFVALCAMLAMGLALMTSPAEAAPFAYVTGSNSVTVIDTATNMVVATVPVGSFPAGVAVAPDGKHVYVTNFISNTVSVIDTATNMVGATVQVGSFPEGVAVTPDGKHAYVANAAPNSVVSVIDTATNTVVATVPVGVGKQPFGIAITPDGKRAYVTNNLSNDVSVIDTVSNTVAGTPTPVRPACHPQVPSALSAIFRCRAMPNLLSQAYPH
jgi:YVTN family beta-propeller protein